MQCNVTTGRGLPCEEEEKTQAHDLAMKGTLDFDHYITTAPRIVQEPWAAIPSVLFLVKIGESSSTVHQSSPPIVHSHLDSAVMVVVLWKGVVSCLL